MRIVVAHADLAKSMPALAVKVTKWRNCMEAKS